MGNGLGAKLALALGTFVFAGTAFSSDFCASTQNPNFFRHRAMFPENRIAFQNPSDGALGLKTGLCWWHSRFQRSLLYLAHTRPLRPGEKPMSHSEIDRVITKLIGESAVVELRGYDSIYEFTRINEKTIHSRFKWWQAAEALNGIKGLRGKPVVSAKKMEKLMGDLYNFVENKKFVAYEMLQYPGITAHSWLVSHITPVYKGLIFDGYELSIIDSNYPIFTQKFRYRPGQTHFVGDFGNFTPYLQWQSSMKRYATALFHYCKPQKAREQLLTNLEKVGFADAEITPEIQRKFTFSARQFAEFNWGDLSNVSGRNNTLALQEE